VPEEGGWGRRGEGVESSETLNLAYVVNRDPSDMGDRARGVHGRREQGLSGRFNRWN
jgi:hypothetical protein